MRTGSKSDKNLLNRVKGNIECYKAWKVNGLRINPLRIILKPLSKIPEYFRHRK